VSLEVTHLSLPKAGEQANGDAVVVRAHAGGTLLVLVDALGHGVAAAETASVAVEYIASLDEIPSVHDIISGLHRRMHGTRGAAVLVCSIVTMRLSGCSVGNVELRSRNDRVPALLTPGIVGSRMRKLHVFEAPLVAGERLVLFSDGLSSRLSARDADGLAGAAACQAFMRMHRRTHDDATVIVVDVSAEG
jgi:negative regulator of sigma-B (phosphoserine phosphatase)